MFYLGYYIVFAIASTILSILFFRIGDEKVATIFTALLALFCWFGVAVNIVNGL